MYTHSTAAEAECQGNKNRQPGVRRGSGGGPEGVRRGSIAPAQRTNRDRTQDRVAKWKAPGVC
eukprot:1113651-Prorocentrum_minimum.AAC.1